jgi:DNA modification methylase
LKLSPVFEPVDGKVTMTKTIKHKGAAKCVCSKNRADARSVVQTTLDLSVTQMPIDMLTPYDRNARTHTRRQLRCIAHSIKKLGFLNPVLVDKNNRIIAGHGRTEAAKLLGHTTVPVIRIEHLTDDQVRAYIIADNRLAELAGWDKEILKTELQHLVSVDVDLDVTVTGFETPEIDLILGADTVAASDEEPAVPDPPKNPVTRWGDHWEIGPHSLLDGDARSEADVARVLAGRQARLVVTDPPFNVKIQGHVSGLGKKKHAEFAMASGEMSKDEFVAFLASSMTAFVPHLMPGALIYEFIDWRHIEDMLAAARPIFGAMHNLGVWVKTNAGMGSHYRSQHELCCIFKHGDAPHVNNVELGRFGRYLSNVWIRAGANTFRRGRDQDLADHPTVKPTSLIADIILDSSKPNEVVLDSFAGSGTALLAAERTGRVGYGIELDPGYVDVALRRLSEATGKVPVLKATGQTFDEVARDRAAKKTKEVRHG